MAGGYMGKILWVNLSNGEIKEETPEENLYRDFIGGYGIGARLLYSRQKAKVDPLGPENIFGLLTGPLVGTPVPSGTRYTAVAKSPLTGGWGDANAGGDFAPHLRFSGYDAVFFTGKSDKPVYLLIDDGKAELRDAGGVWGKDSYETEDTLKAELGKGTELVCIGQSGEKLSLISCIVGNRGAAAARSGLGAVMGSKKLKAVVARGNRPVPIADRERVMQLRKEHLDEIKRPGPDGGMSYFDRFHTYGTASMTSRSAHSGDSPVKNWGGIGIVDFPDISQLTPDASIANLEKHSGCWQCPVQCEGRMKAGIEYNYPRGTRRPEYETYSSFGSMCLNNNLEAINMANHICNAYGLDTISAGATIAFAMECYENGIITKKDTGGIELTWGNHKAMIDMTWKLAKREGLGDILADGVKVAAEKIGKGAEKFAIHVGGQELPMHDPKLMTGFGAARTTAALYHIEPTPARHMQGIGPSGFVTHIVNVTGVCIAGGHRRNIERLAGWVSAVTGVECSVEELLKAGERIVNIRHAFNLREGINPLKWAVHPRMIGDPPHTQGPLTRVRTDIEAQDYWNLGQLDWDRVTTKPSKAKLLSLGLDDVAKDLWPPAPPPGPRPG
ncbi:MAG TPA: aldehyde ferredoxin oxidoreductase family protein [Dehalococcoidales bacterium]|nr:aldehyde ferredoxin oxidoreductase family protein [Dehalococcoidales bacterium]